MFGCRMLTFYCLLLEVEHDDVILAVPRVYINYETNSLKLAPVLVAVNVNVMKLIDLVGFTNISA